MVDSEYSMDIYKFLKIDRYWNNWNNNVESRNVKISSSLS